MGVVLPLARKEKSPEAGSPVKDDGDSGSTFSRHWVLCAAKLKISREISSRSRKTKELFFQLTKEQDLISPDGYAYGR